MKEGKRRRGYRARQPAISVGSSPYTVEPGKARGGGSSAGAGAASGAQVLVKRQENKTEKKKWFRRMSQDPQHMCWSANASAKNIRATCAPA